MAQPLLSGDIVADRAKFKANFLQWRITRRARSYRIYVVEPDAYRPEHHGRVFNAALTALVAPELSRADPFAPHPPIVSFTHFDLVTFPEAFLPKEDLLSALTGLSSLDSLGCVHVGLRPTMDRDQHLFHVTELSQLVESLANLPKIERTDLIPFSDWLQAQSCEQLFNIGCLFTIDSDGRLRVCLHPKLIRSRFEVNPLHEHHMTEADLLTVVTLLPSDRALFSVTVQPLLCSDVLQLSTDRPHSRPMDAVNTDAHCLGDRPPDHIDVVSVATCSPQQELPTSKGDRCRVWHQEFRESFRRAALDDSLARHHYAVFVLANFRNSPDSKPGGLSGIFIPLPISGARYPTFVNVSSYGRPKDGGGGENQWSPPGRAEDIAEKQSSLGHIASLDPLASGNSTAACMLGVTVVRLPRDTSRLGPTEGLADFQIWTATYDPGDANLAFVQMGASDE